jgi:hypothetical protein
MYKLMHFRLLKCRVEKRDFRPTRFDDRLNHEASIVASARVPSPTPISSNEKLVNRRRSIAQETLHHYIIQGAEERGKLMFAPSKSN